MCLIAHVPAGKSLSREIFDHANGVNPDGIGVMSVKGIEKFFGNKQLKRARLYVDGLAKEGIAHAVHWRYATHGSKQLALCHPFKLPVEGADVWLMHNGVITGMSKEVTNDVSDTLAWVNKLVDAPIVNTDLEYWNKKCTEIGKYNKGLVMYPEGKFVILNQDEGSTIGGIWYSNQYSLPAKERTNEYHFRPARLSPRTYYPNESGSTSGYYDTRSRSSGVVVDRGPFGHIYWSEQFKAYGFWEGQQFQKLVVTKGERTSWMDLVSRDLPTAVTVVTPTGTDDSRRCGICGRFNDKRDAPHGFLECYCTDEAKAAYKAKIVGPSGPTSDTATVVPAAKIEMCEHGSDNWENCRDCIEELETETGDEVQRWLADRQGIPWRLRSKDPQVRADELARKVVELRPNGKASEK